MSLARFAKRRDANERYIVEALERVGAEVWITDRPADLLVWFRRRWFVLEVKMPHGKLSERQKDERAEGLCEGVRIVRTPLDALKAIGAVGESSLGIEADPRLAQEAWYHVQQEALANGDLPLREAIRRIWDRITARHAVPPA